MGKLPWEMDSEMEICMQAFTKEHSWKCRLGHWGGEQDWAKGKTELLGLSQSHKEFWTT